MIVQTGRNTNKNIRNFQGIRTIDDKNSILTKLTDVNIGSVYAEFREDGTGIDAVYVLNLDVSNSLTWYKI